MEPGEGKEDTSSSPSKESESDWTPDSIYILRNQLPRRIRIEGDDDHRLLYRRDRFSVRLLHSDSGVRRPPRDRSAGCDLAQPRGGRALRDHEGARRPARSGPFEDPQEPASVL